MTAVGPGPDRLRPARHGRAAARQPLDQQRAAQHLPHQRRPLGGGVHQRPDHRRAGARGWSGHPEVIDEPWFASGARPGRARRPDRRVRRRLDRRAHPRRGARGVRRGRSRGRPGLQRQGHRRGRAHPGRREMLIEVDDPDLGPVLMHNVMWRMSADARRGSGSPGGPRGADTDAILRRTNSGYGRQRDRGDCAKKE